MIIASLNVRFLRGGHAPINSRRGFFKFGADIGARGISWSNSHQGEIAVSLAQI
jgi:hypothetical protein